MFDFLKFQLRTKSGRPRGLKWRSSVWFTTFVVGFGVSTDIAVYSIVVPVLPFQLERLGYSGVAALVGWILFSYSGGIVISTPPIAMLSERYNSRQPPFVLALVVLIGSQIMMMEAPVYWLMCLARILQGVSSSVVWVVGLALMCDTVPEANVGRQLGFVMSGLSIGSLIGPPVGGVLFNAFGFRGPFIFGIILTFVDLIGRLLIIERKNALPWGVDPSSLPKIEAAEGDAKTDLPQNAQSTSSRHDTEKGAGGMVVTESTVHTGMDTRASLEGHQATTQVSNDSPDATVAVVPRKHLSTLGVVGILAKSSRALTALFITVAYGLVIGCQEPTLPLHTQAIWGLNSTKVGLLYIAAVVPTLFSSPLAGVLGDRKGVEWVVSTFLVMALPWWLIIIINGPLALFVVAFAIENFFIAGALSPIMAELAAVTRSIEDVGYGHMYGAFNLAFGIGTMAGPLLGGQIYDHVRQGWLAICLLGAGFIVVSIIVSFCYTGEQPLLTKLRLTTKRRRERHIATIEDMPIV